jgi:hypothetical protein
MVHGEFLSLLYRRTHLLHGRPHLWTLRTRAISSLLLSTTNCRIPALAVSVPYKAPIISHFEAKFLNFLHMRIFFGAKQ